MKQILTAVGLGFLAVLAYFEHLLLWVYVGSGVTLLAAIHIHRLIFARRQVSNIQFQPRVVAFGRIRRFVRKVNSETYIFMFLSELHI